MANYTTNTSDKKKKTAFIWWAVGLLGLLGLEYFYVCKFKKCFVRAFFGILYASVIVMLIQEEPSMIPVAIIMWAVVAIPNLFRILCGVFKDNVGEPLRK